MDNLYFEKNMTDERIMSVISAMDRVEKPLRDRFEGDDEPITTLMQDLELQQDVASKLLVTGQVLREAVSRGLQVPKTNKSNQQLSFENNLSNEKIIEIIQSLDRIDNPLALRSDGDDNHIVAFMQELGLKQDIVSKLLITGRILREASSRGIQLSKQDLSNSGPKL